MLALTTRDLHQTSQADGNVWHLRFENGTDLPLASALTVAGLDPRGVSTFFAHERGCFVISSDQFRIKWSHKGAATSIYIHTATGGKHLVTKIKPSAQATKKKPIAPLFLSLSLFTLFCVNIWDGTVYLSPPLSLAWVLVGVSISIVWTESQNKGLIEENRWREEGPVNGCWGWDSKKKAEGIIA